MSRSPIDLALLLVLILPLHAIAGVQGDYAPWGYDLSGQEPETKPGDDFYRFANGRWTDRTAIAPDRSENSIDRGLNDQADLRMRAILERGAEGVDPAAAADARKAAAIYASFMDAASVERRGLEPIARDLETLRAGPSHQDLGAAMGRAAASFSPSLFKLSIITDPKTPHAYAVEVGQGGLGLPDRDYYRLPTFGDKKAAYLSHIGDMLERVGWAEPRRSAAAILAFETAVAEASWTLTEQRDSDRTYNPVTLEALEQLAPDFPWRAFLDGAGLGVPDRLIAAEITAIPKLAALFAETPSSTLSAWSAFRIADKAAPFLADEMVQLNFRFRSKTLEGVDALPERWKRGVELANELIGEGIGRVYVARYFEVESKRATAAMVDQLRSAFARRLERIDWISPETRTKALDKLGRMTAKIAYPDRWRDYSGLDVTDDLVGNVLRGRAFEWRRRAGRIHGPVDRADWNMSPQTVNAYYSVTFNEIVLPAGELQPPYFDPAADPAVNFGAAGAFIGHEMSHGFDDDGRRYDGDGALSTWWTEADVGAFSARADELARQYSRFEPLPGTSVNGALTLGENIADLGGVLIALDAYRASLGGRPAPVIDGWTGEQRFFLSFAQQWRVKRTEASLRRMLVADPHAPEVARVNGPLRNVDAWYEAFDVRPGHRLFLPPDMRVRLW